MTGDVPGVLNKTANSTFGYRMEGRVSAQATGTYRERPSAGPLQEHFKCTWVHQLPAGAPGRIEIVPDGCIDLEWIAGSLRIAGPDRVSRTEILPLGATVIGFRFSAGSAAAWLGLPASDLLDSRIPLEELWGIEARQLAQAVNAASDVAARVHALENALLRRAPSISLRHGDMRAAYRLIAGGAPPGKPLVRWLAQELDMSERTLRRRFDEAFGYGPKTLDRILRFQRFLELARCDGDASAAGLAAAAGYADQAHLARESRRLTATTPRQIVEALVDS